MSPTCLHMFSGSGGGALGFRRAGFRSLGSFDVDAQACQDLEYLTGEPATVLDIGAATSVDLHAATRGETPDVVFASPPCKGFSGCLPTKSAKSARYTAMNSLAERGIFMALEAWERKPPLIILENVPRMRERGAEWLARVIKMLQANGYAVDDRTHDCGVVGGLAQHRRRLLVVARHMEQVPSPLRLPPPQRVRGVGEVLGLLPPPIPGSTAGGPMHALPRLIPLTWLRLALIPAGGDWRDLPESVSIGYRPHNGSWGVQDWASASPTVKGCHQYSNATGAVSDPRLGCSPRAGSYGVAGWLDASGTAAGPPGPSLRILAVVCIEGQLWGWRRGRPPARYEATTTYREASIRRRLSLIQLTDSERAHIEIIASAGPQLPAPVGKVTKGL